MLQVSSPTVSGIKIEKPIGGSVKVGTASSITIGRQQSSTGNVVKIVTPTKSPSAATSNVKVVRVVNPSSGQKVIQLNKPSSVQQPRILNQTWSSSEVKSEPASSRSSITIVRKSDQGVNNEEPVAKKTKYITLTTSQINQIEGATILGGGKSKRIVMLPSNYREQLDKISTSPTSVSAISSGGNTFKIVQEVNKYGSDGIDVTSDPLNESLLMSGKKSKRPCNCTKSQCLKFYCDCFAAGEYCSGCNCKDCFNEHDSEEREKAVKLCMERNPFAFR